MSAQAVVVDTDVVSFLFKKDTRAKAYRAHLVGRTPVLCFMTVAELYRWAEVRNWGGKRRAALQQHVRNFVVYSCDDELCRTWAELMAQAERDGRPLNCADGWIAATAVRNDVPLVPHNAKDFESRPGLRVICEAGN